MRLFAITDYAHIKSVIWDFDGVFYDYDVDYLPAGTINRVFHEANVSAVCEVLDLSFEEAMAISIQSYDNHRDVLHDFVPIAKEQGWDEKEVKFKIFTLFYQKAYEVIPRDYPELFAPRDGLINLLESSKERINHTVLTHSCTENWTKLIAQKMNILSYMGCWIGFDQYDMKPKGKSSDGLDLVFEKTGYRPDQSVFIEDSIRHLEIAKNAYPDMLTVLKGDMHGQEKPNYVDFVVNTAEDFLRLILK